MARELAAAYPTWSGLAAAMMVVAAEEEEEAEAEAVEAKSIL